MGRPGNNPYCIHRALDHERRGLRERLVRVQPAPGEPFDHGRFETIVEPMPERGTEASILGVPLDAVLALDPRARGLFDAAESKHRLRVI
jgi:hypothetical protein